MSDVESSIDQIPSNQHLTINRVAITGANGFIGKALVKAFLAQGVAVNALVRTPASLPHDSFWSDCNVIQGNLSDQSALKQLCSESEVVIHCAAFMGKKDPELSDQVNIEGTRQVILAAQETQAKRFIYVSSISVYRGTHSPNRVFSETLEPYLNPKLNHYSRSKLEGEHLCKTLCQEHGLEYVIVRPTNVYGPGCRPWGSQVENLVSRYHICFGRVVFNFIHIDDLVQGFLLISKHKNAQNQDFNLAAEPVELSLFHKHIANKLGVWTWRLPWLIDAIVRYSIDGLAKLRGEVRSTGYTPKFHYPHEKAKRLLSYEPQHLIYTSSQPK